MKIILLGVMYRDGANYKTADYESFTNKKGLTLEEIERAIEETVGFDEPIMVQDYGIGSLAPLSNEFLPIDDDQVDHSYCEITTVTDADYEGESKWIEKDISDVVELLYNPDFSGEARRQKQAIEIMQERIREIQNQISQIQNQ